jgi:photosynthetic reaction center cytochrome c subunit
MSKTRNQIRDEMTGLLLRGGFIGILMFLAAIAFMVIPVQLGKIWPTEGEQTGFRGTGMNVVEFVSDNADLAAANVMPVAEVGPIPPEPGEPLARDVYPNSEPLGHLTARNYERLVAAMREWVGNDTLFSEEETYATAVARNMIEMVWNINENWDGHVAQTGVTCYTCHRGNAVPSNVWFSPEPLNSWAGPSANMQNQARAANYSTALPVDALQVYLLEDSQLVGVHGYAPRDEDGSSNVSIYHTYQTFALMQHFSNSLGVNCTYCHNTRAPAEPEGHTPQWGVAQLGRAMVVETNNEYVLPNLPLLPEERLGPLGDVSKVSCTTCHQGAAKPLLGQSMLADWPELASSEPTYE